MSVKMKFGSKDIPFVYKGDKLIYPNPIKDGLLLWYDFKGIRNTDTAKEVAKDLSGNGNDGTLTNFNFTEESGYKDNTLVFDGVDDKLVIPELELDETAMSVEIDGKVYVYDGDKVVSIDKDSSILATNKNLYGEHISIEKDQTEGATTLVRNHPNAPFGFYTVGARGNVSFVQLNNIFPQEGIYTVSWEMGGNQNTATQNAISTHEGVASEIFVNPSTNNETKKFSYTFEVTDISTQNWLRFDRFSWLWYYFKYIDVRMVSHPVEFSPNPYDLQKTTFTPSHLKSMQIYNKPLLKEELLHNTESKGLKKLKPGVVVQDGLVLHYDFSYESNISEYKGKAFDYSGSGNHGVLNNFNFTGESGYEGEGLKFDGVDDFIGGKTGSLLSLDSKNESIEITFEITHPEHSSSSLALLKSGGVIGSINVFSGWGRVTITDNIGINHIYTPDRESLIGKKTHLILTKNNGLFTAHINGELVEMKEYDTELDKPLVLESLSRGSGTLAYDSTLISSRIYNRPLTPEEIQHNYQIEKERFGFTDTNSLPIGKAIIGKTNKVGGDR